MVKIGYKAKITQIYQKIRTWWEQFEAKSTKKIRTFEPQQKFTGSYKKRVYKYSPFTLTWLMTNDFQVELFSINSQKQWKLSVCKKVINQVRMNGL